MALPNWTKANGELTEVEERTSVDIGIPLESTEGITVSIISGELPPGLRIDNYRIKGVPFEVGKTTEFEFVIRASNTEGIADRTYKITVIGADEPVWQTEAGPLPLKKTFRNQYWVDTLNTQWGIYKSNSGWQNQTVNIYETIPSRSEGSNGDFAFVNSFQQFWYNINNRWYRINDTQIQGVLGTDTGLIITDTVPNPNVEEFWFNTNK